MSRRFLPWLATVALVSGCSDSSRELAPLVTDGGSTAVSDAGVSDVGDAATTEPSVDASSSDADAPVQQAPDAPPVVTGSDAPPIVGVPDAPPVLGLPDAPPIVAVPDAPVGVPVPDAPPVVTVPDAPPVVTVPDAPPVVTVPDAPPPVLTWTTADGLANPIIDVSTDDAGNVWAISPDTLFLLTPGAPGFVAFGNADGLHVEPFIGPDGSAQVTRLTAVAGATANRVYLGYLGYESDDPFNDTDAQKRLGNGDRIDYDPATGAITVNRYEFRCVVEVSRCWEDRSVRRIVVGHSGAAAGHAFFGFNHGTTQVWNDILGDHVHPEINWVMGTTVTTKYGECQALALNDDGTLWIGNRYGVGLMNWNPDPIAWTTAKFRTAFTTYTDNHALDVPWGYTEDNRGAAVAPDGTLWLASYTRGLTSWVPSSSYAAMTHWTATPDLPTATYTDIVADLDGTIWLVVQDGRLLHFDPTTSTLIPTGIFDARHLYLDKTVTPRALYVARYVGITVIRQ